MSLHHSKDLPMPTQDRIALQTHIKGGYYHRSEVLPW